MNRRKFLKLFGAIPAALSLASLQSDDEPEEDEAQEEEPLPDTPYFVDPGPITGSTNSVYVAVYKPDEEYTYWQKPWIND